MRALPRALGILVLLGVVGCSSDDDAGASGGAKNESIEFYRSPFIEYAIVFYMFVAGANFSLHYRVLKGEPQALFRDPEFRFYLAVVLFSTLLIMANLFGSGLYKSLLDCFRLAIFQVVSIQTTTGYTSADFEKWPAFSQYVLFLLMFVGGCAGSTGGAIKCVRILILLKHGAKELKQRIHPHAVIPVKLGGKILSPGTINGVWALSFLYMLVPGPGRQTLCFDHQIGDSRGPA